MVRLVPTPVGVNPRNSPGWRWIEAIVICWSAATIGTIGFDVCDARAKQRLSPGTRP